MLNINMAVIVVTLYISIEDDVIIRTKRKHTATIGLIVHAAGTYVVHKSLSLT